MAVYYNEIWPPAAAKLRSLIADGLIPPGHVDESDIRDIIPADLEGYTQCHFFAGIGGWAYAARLAGWPDDRPLWTGSCPCQPWSIAGRRAGRDDERHLWKAFARLIRILRPPVLMGEQVADAAGQGWLDEVADDMEAVHYAFRAVVFPACAVGAFHRRDRIYFVADTSGEGLPGAKQSGGGQPGQEATEVRASASERDCGPPWRDHRQSVGADGLTRMVKPGVRLLAHGIPDRMAALSAFGNAVVPQQAAEVIAAYMEACAEQTV